MKAFAAVLLFTCFLVSYVHGRISGRIVGGSETSIENHPYQAFLQTRSGEFLCGASILNKRYLLTVASCFHVNVHPSNMVAIVGTNNASDASGQAYQVESVVPHEKYTRPGNTHGVNDVAIVRVRKNIVFSDKVQPIKLPSANEEIADNSTVTFSAWGAQQRSGVIKTRTLQQVQLKIHNHKACKFDWLRLKLISIEDSMLCTVGVRGVGLCYGDAGSPLVNSNGVQVGIGSFGYPCAYGYPDVFTRVSSYVDWIKEFLE